jgi:2,5-furandicarboxylate decarboxylase 1
MEGHCRGRLHMPEDFQAGIKALHAKRPAKFKGPEIQRPAKLSKQELIVTTSHSTTPDQTPHGRNSMPPGAELRSWLAHLEKNSLLAHAKPGVKLEFELAGITNRLDGRKAVFFPAPKGHSVPVVSGIVSDRGWMAQALGVTEDELVQHFQNAVSNPLPTTTMDTPPCQQEIHRDVDLVSMLPIPTHNELDSGAYITAGLIIVKNPQTGIQNVAIVRLQISGKNRLGALILPRHTLAFNDMMEKQGKDLDIAIVIGASPAELLASQAIVPMNFDELEIAGALTGASLPVAKCINSEIVVPAHAEIVLEGRLLAGERAPEGPFGEFPQYYGERADRHVIGIDLITHRKDPIFHTIVGGGLEHLLLGCIPREATILQSIQRTFPNVTNVTLARGGVCRYHLYVQMNPRSAGEAKNVIMAAFASHYDVKQVIVVDTDVNIHQPREVEWAVATRFQAASDLVIVNNSQGSKLDPSTDNGLGSKMGLDATKPVDAAEFTFKRICVPGQEDIDLDAWLDPSASLPGTYTAT